MNGDLLTLGNFALKIFETIEGPANWEISFLNAWKHTATPTQRKFKQAISKCKIRGSNFWLRKKCHIDRFHIQKQNLQWRCLQCNSEKAATSLSKKEIGFAYWWCHFVARQYKATYSSVRVSIVPIQSFSWQDLLLS